MKASKENLYGYNKKLQPLAHRLRGEMTKAEAALWKYALSARQMKGYQFRRERPVLNFIADFMCKELLLIVEVDGLSHSWDETMEKDVRKDEALQNAGFTVLRFTDVEVLKGMESVIRAIEITIERLEKERGIQPPPPAEDRTAKQP